MTDILRNTSTMKAAKTVDIDPTQPVVRLRNLVKRFRRADGTVANAIDGVSLDVMPGEFVVLLGPSGCGKTTLLRTIAGLERPDAGTIDIDGRVGLLDVAGRSSCRRSAATSA